MADLEPYVQPFSSKLARKDLPRTSVSTMITIRRTSMSTMITIRKRPERSERREGDREKIQLHLKSNQQHCITPSRSVKLINSPGHPKTWIAGSV